MANALVEDGAGRPGWASRRPACTGSGARSGCSPGGPRRSRSPPDPLLIDKIRDAAGLDLAPPANAAVFSVDEKPQIQALERTAPVLPMLPGVPERRSFDYVRHGTIDLFAALNIATGKGRPQAVRPAPGGGLP